MIPLFVLPLHCWWCWRALPAAIITFVKSLHCTNHHPIRIGDERERLVTASPVMTKSRAPAGRNNYPENGLVKPPRRDTRALSPAGMFGRKAPLRLAAQKSRPHAPSLPPSLPSLHPYIPPFLAVQWSLFFMQLLNSLAWWQFNFPCLIEH